MLTQARSMVGSEPTCTWLIRNCPVTETTGTWTPSIFASSRYRTATAKVRDSKRVAGPGSPLTLLASDLQRHLRIRTGLRDIAHLMPADISSGCNATARGDHMLRWMRGDGLKRATFVALGLLLAFQGVSAMLRGESGYRNYWGGLVFPPVAIGLGLLLVFATLRRGLWSRERGGRRGRPRRLR